MMNSEEASIHSKKRSFESTDPSNETDATIIDPAATPTRTVAESNEAENTLTPTAAQTGTSNEQNTSPAVNEVTENQSSLRYQSKSNKDEAPLAPTNAFNEPDPPDVATEQASKANTEDHGVPLTDPNSKSTTQLRLESSIARLQSQLTSTTSQMNEMRSEICNLEQFASHRTLATDNDNKAEQDVVMDYSKDIVSRHISLLHRYNAIRDVGMGLVSLIADGQGRRLGDVMEERGLKRDD